MKEEVRLVKLTIRILDSPKYVHYSEGRADNYLSYFMGHRADEDRLIAPVLLPKFLEQILGFKLGETLGTKEAGADGKPDFIPIDKQTHPFVFDAKGSDTEDLPEHYGEKRKYLAIHGFQYLILVNMRELAVFTLDSSEPLEKQSFSFYSLYRDFQEDSKGVLQKENTRQFLRFVERFRYHKLSLEEKLERVKAAKPWTGEEELDARTLTNRLRHIVNFLYEDAKRKRKEIEAFLETDPEKAKTIAQEIELIASEIFPAHEVIKATEETFQDIFEAPAASLYARALDTFFYRVAYFAMTRLLLVRAWEDIGFIDQTLYNGGLAEWYDKFNHKIREVLEYAFRLAAERYRWLFNVDNNYSWFEPSDEVLIEVLYELSNFNLGKLNRDILGAIYEEYIDRVDKKRKGQYYTPREIVSFIWDRVGYTDPEAFFDFEKGKRKPKPVYDPATGSGGFLVEAARRLREKLGINSDDFQDLLDIRTTILYGLFGSEISVFPYYITEVNLLIQLTPVVKRMIDFRRHLKESLPMGVLPVDSLSLHNSESLADQVDRYHADEFHNILPLDRQKRAIYRKIKEDLAGKFYYCCANPPYVGEKGHKELFRSTLDRYPYWQQFYQGKMDYLYWFTILGLSKLREGGKLGFITTAYWPTADGAAKLRKFILENAKIKEMVFFEDVKIFEHAKGQHNMVFVLEKCPGKEKSKERDENRIKIARVLAKHQDVPGERISEKLSFLTRHLSAHLDEDKYEDEYIELFWSGVKQGELPKDGDPWHFEYAFGQDAVLRLIAQQGVPLDAIFNINSGVQSGADKVTAKNIKLLTTETLSTHSIDIGDGIFVLSEEELRNLHLSADEQNIIRRFFKNSDIEAFITSSHENIERSFLIYSYKINIDDYPNIRTHLEKYRPILENKREYQTGKRKWYELQWPRRKEIFEGPKLVNPQRAPIESPAYFAYSEEPSYASVDVYFTTPKEGTKESLLYLLGILNSGMIKSWLASKCKRKGASLELYRTPLAQIPIRGINFDDPEEVKLHDTIVENVKTIREKMMELSRYSKYFTGPRLTKLGFDEPLPELDEQAIIENLSDEKVYSIRTHPSIKIIKPPKFEDSGFCLQKVSGVADTLEGPELKLVAKDKAELILVGPRDLLDLLARLLHGWKGKRWDEIKENLLLPESAKTFAKRQEELLSTVDTLRDEIASIQTKIDEVVYRLYKIDETSRETIRKRSGRYSR